MASTFVQPFGHWSTLIEGLQASPQECYAAIEEAIRSREIPDVKISRVTHKEAGPLFAERIYLRREPEEARLRYLRRAFRHRLLLERFFELISATSTSDPRMDRRSS